MYDAIGPMRHTEPGGATTAPAHRGCHRGYGLANGGERLVAGFIDHWVPWALLSEIPVVGMWLALAVIVWNSAWMQSMTGQSFGKRIMALPLVQPIRDPETDVPYLRLPGFWRCLVRLWVHTIDVPIGVLRVFVNERREAIADSVGNTLVISKLTLIQDEPARACNRRIVYD